MGHGRSDARPTAALHPVLAVVAFGLAAAVLRHSLRILEAFASVGLSFGPRASLVVLELLIVLPSLLLLTVAGPRAFALRRLSGRQLLVTAFLGGTLWIASAGLLELQSALSPPTPEFVRQFRALHAMLKPKGPLDAVLSVLTIAVTPAVCEEIVFRGVLLPSLARWLGLGGAVAASATMFAFIHVDGTSFVRVPFAFLMGLALGGLRVRTASLSAPILVHAVVNTLTFLVAPFVDDPSQAVPEPHTGLGSLALLAGVSASLALMRKLAGGTTASASTV
jgi:membrane protease YdiL (CAAX protease family)